MGSDTIKFAPARFGLKSVRTYLLLFSLFFLICLGLGYSTLHRYQPPTVPGLSDSAIYYQLVLGSPFGLSRPYMRCRILVPFLAKPFYQLARKLIPSIDAVAFGLLISNSLLCALGVCFLVSIGTQITAEPLVGMLAATLYLLSFAIPNLQLAGLVDSGEACFMLATTWSLLLKRWWLLPVWGILGALSKETFVPLSIVFCFAWSFTEWRRRGTDTHSQFKWIALQAFAGVATMTALHSIVAGEIIWPWNIAAQARAGTPIYTAFFHAISNRSFWYVFIWLLPLGVLGIKRIPRPWVVASLVAGVAALALGAWRDMLGQVARPLFNVIGPMLSLSVAILLARVMSDSRNQYQQNQD